MINYTYFYAFNTIIKLFFTIPYQNNYSNIDISRPSFSGIPPFLKKGSIFHPYLTSFFLGTWNWWELSELFYLTLYNIKYSFSTSRIRQLLIDENIIATTKIRNKYGAIQSFKFPILRYKSRFSNRKLLHDKNRALHTLHYGIG